MHATLRAQMDLVLYIYRKACTSKTEKHQNSEVVLGVHPSVMRVHTLESAWEVMPLFKQLDTRNCIGDKSTVY